jgi:hypothetical protein
LYTCFALKFLVQCCIFFQGGWWIAKKFDDIPGNTAIEMEDMRYVAGRRGRDRMVVGFITTYAISAYHH